MTRNPVPARPTLQKLIDEIQLRGFSPHAQDSCVRSVTGLARFHHRSPDQISDDEIKGYLLHLLRVKNLACSSLIVAVSGLRFFFGTVLHRPTTAIEQALPRMKKPVLRPCTVSRSWSSSSNILNSIADTGPCS